MENNTNWHMVVDTNYNVRQSLYLGVGFHANIGLGGDVVIFGADTWDVPSSQDLVAMRIATNLAVEPNGRYNSFSIHTFVNSNSTLPASLIDSAKIYIHMGHGGSTGQVANKSMTASLSRDSFSNLSNLDLVIFMGCETAETPETGLNLPAKATSVGSAVSVGFVEQINDTPRGSTQSYTTLFGNFYKTLFEQLYQDKSMSEIQNDAIDLFENGFESMALYKLSGKDFSLVDSSQ